MTRDALLQTFIDEFARRLRDEAEQVGRGGALTAALMLRRVAQDLELQFRAWCAQTGTGQP